MMALIASLSTEGEVPSRATPCRSCKVARVMSARIGVAPSGRSPRCRHSRCMRVVITPSPGQHRRRASAMISASMPLPTPIVWRSRGTCRTRARTAGPHRLVRTCRPRAHRRSRRLSRRGRRNSSRVVRPAGWRGPSCCGAQLNGRDDHGMVGHHQSDFVRPDIGDVPCPQLESYPGFTRRVLPSLGTTGRSSRIRDRMW